MDRYAKKGTCSDCKVCKAYLRAAGRNQLMKESACIEGKEVNADRVGTRSLPKGAAPFRCGSTGTSIPAS
ncbi:MAG: hypothetical protein P1P89_20715 [Desulfobacterales bacterium]|nr:hypothetical protein [Desulfobacterales bacterium]